MTKTEKVLVPIIAASFLVMLGASLQHRISHPSLVKESHSHMPTTQATGMSDDGIGILMRKAGESPNDFNTMLSIANELLGQGKLDAAENFAQRAMALDATNAQPPYILGYIRVQQGKFNEALTLMEQSLALEDKPGVHFSAGVILKYYLNDATRAAEHWKKGLASPKASEKDRNLLQEELAKLK